MKLAERLLDIALEKKPADAEALLATEVDGQTVAALVEGESARIGEKLVLSRFAAFEGTTATYLHKRATDLPPAIGVAVQYSGGTEEAARSLAMHIAAARPRFLTREEVPAETVETERRVAEQTAKEEGKPEQAIVKIVEGRSTSTRTSSCSSSRRSPSPSDGEADRRRGRPDRGAVRPLRGRPGLRHGTQCERPRPSRERGRSCMRQDPRQYRRRARDDALTDTTPPLSAPTAFQPADGSGYHRCCSSSPVRPSAAARSASTR